MKTETSPTPSPSGLTRRSFIKRSVVAAVAVSSMTIFSGLVNAESDAASGTLPDADQASLNSCNIPLPIGCVTGTCYATNKHDGALCVVTCVNKKPVRCS